MGKQQKQQHQHQLTELISAVAELHQRPEQHHNVVLFSSMTDSLSFLAHTGTICCIRPPCDASPVPAQSSTSSSGATSLHTGGIYLA
jgi:hypothetical protein